LPYIHEAYAKSVLRAVFGSRFNGEAGLRGNSVPDTAGVTIDGVIDSHIAVEIESGTAKVVAADADRLVRHHFPFKLLVVVPVNQYNPETAAQLARQNMAGSLDASRFRVVVLDGTGKNPMFAHDVEKLRAELNAWV
jgi:hypothetical protein